MAMLNYHRYQLRWYVLQGLKERAKVLGLDLVTHTLSDKVHRRLPICLIRMISVACWLSLSMIRRSWMWW
ncbi:MAG: hypothetical protein ACSLEN_04350 [Candidatus Malihini olakiniferum]